MKFVVRTVVLILFIAMVAWLTHDYRSKDNSDTSAFETRMLGRSRKQRRNLKVRPVRFYAMGDAPYSQTERDNLPHQLDLLDPTADFVIHLGDMQDRLPTCVRPPYQALAQTLIDRSPLPTFIVPGDNCYYDCRNWQDGFKFWKESFHGLDGNWTTPFNVRKQNARMENFAITWHRVLFIGIHTLWTRKVKDSKEWNRIENDNVDWTRNQLRNFASVGKVDAVVILSHSYTRKALYDKYWTFISEQAEELDMPVLFLQGDAHRFRQDTPFGSDNILRTVVDRGGIADPVLVTVDLSKDNPFQFEHRELSGM